MLTLSKEITEIKIMGIASFQITYFIFSEE